MIIADKIMMLRKKCGWSQEELAEKMSVSRQAVSKWEGAQSIPDLDKILKLSQLFGVSTDFLLKDTMEEAEPTMEDAAEDSALRRVSMEEAVEFLRIKQQSAGRIAIATFLCIISPICLIFLTTAAETKMLAISEELAAGIGLTVLLLLVTAAVAVFIACGIKSSPFEFLEKELFETAYGVNGMVMERKKQFQGHYTRRNIIGTSLCILGAIPLIVTAMLTGDGAAVVVALIVTLIVVGIGVICFIQVGIPWESMQKLLQEGDYTREKKRKYTVRNTVASVYWLVVTAGYLAYSFSAGDWGRSWIVWPVAGVLYAALVVVIDASQKKE